MTRTVGSLRATPYAFAPRRVFFALLAAAACSACWAGDGRPGWMPERPNIASDWYSSALGHSAQTIAIERPERLHAKGREFVLTTTFTTPQMREWAARSTQIDVVDYEIVVLHEPRGPVPAAIEAKLVFEPDLSDGVHAGLVDGRWAFVLGDGTWVLAAMGYIDRVRAALARSRPPWLSIPSDVSQLVLISRPGPPTRPPCGLENNELTCTGPIDLSPPREGLEWFLFATKTDGTYATHAHYTSEEAVETGAHALLPLTVEEAYQHGAELYMRGH